MINLTIDEQVKIAERDKYLAEANKAITEQARIQFELDELLKESKKEWYRKKEFGYNISKWAVGIGFLIFFINYAVLPATNKNNIELATSVAMANDSLFNRKMELKRSYAILK